MSKYKVGDKVRVKKDLNGGSRYDDLHFNIEMEKYRGKDTTILEVRGSNRYYLELAGTEWIFNDSMLENIQTITTINDLRFGDILTLRNGERYVFASEGAMFGEKKSYGRHCDTVRIWYNSDLTREQKDRFQQDIMKVERQGEIVFERKDVREMTVEEISKALGYEVKVVK